MDAASATQRDQSIAHHEAHLRADPGNAALLVALADLYHRAGRFDDAHGALQRCLAEHPRHALARGRVAAVNARCASSRTRTLATQRCSTGSGPGVQIAGISRARHPLFK